MRTPWWGGRVHGLGRHPHRLFGPDVSDTQKPGRQRTSLGNCRASWLELQSTHEYVPLYLCSETELKFALEFNYAESRFEVRLAGNNKAVSTLGWMCVKDCELPNTQVLEPIKGVDGSTRADIDSKPGCSDVEDLTLKLKRGWLSLLQKWKHDLKTAPPIDRRSPMRFK